MRPSLWRSLGVGAMAAVGMGAALGWAAPGWPWAPILAAGLGVAAMVGWAWGEDRRARQLNRQPRRRQAMRAVRTIVLAVALVVASAAPAAATSRPPYCSNPFCYSYIKTHPDGTREQCNVYWDGTEQCRELHAIPRWTYNPWVGWRLNWLWVL